MDVISLRHNTDDEISRIARAHESGLMGRRYMPGAWLQAVSSRWMRKEATSRRLFSHHYWMIDIIATSISSSAFKKSSIWSGQARQRRCYRIWLYAIGSSHAIRRIIRNCAEHDFIISTYLRYIWHWDNLESRTWWTQFIMSRGAAASLVRYERYRRSNGECRNTMRILSAITFSTSFDDDGRLASIIGLISLRMQEFHEGAGNKAGASSWRKEENKRIERSHDFASF